MLRTTIWTSVLGPLAHYRCPTTTTLIRNLTVYPNLQLHQYHHTILRHNLLRHQLLPLLHSILMRILRGEHATDQSSEGAEETVVEDVVRTVVGGIGQGDEGADVAQITEQEDIAPMLQMTTVLLPVLPQVDHRRRLLWLLLARQDNIPILLINKISSSNPQATRGAINTLVSLVMSMLTSSHMCNLISTHGLLQCLGLTWAKVSHNQPKLHMVRATYMVVARGVTSGLHRVGHHRLIREIMTLHIIVTGREILCFNIYITY
jgi:hypothetical protein